MIATVEQATVINRPVDAVFAILAVPENHPENTYWSQTARRRGKQNRPQVASFRTVDRLPGFNTADRDEITRDLLNVGAHPASCLPARVRPARADGLGQANTRGADQSQRLRPVVENPTAGSCATQKEDRACRCNDLAAPKEPHALCTPMGRGRFQPGEGQLLDRL